MTRRLLKLGRPDKSYVKADVKEPVTVAVTDFKLDLFDVFEGRKVVVSDVTEANFPSLRRIS